MFGQKKWKQRSGELELSLRKAQEYITDILTYRAGEKAQAISANANPYDSREKLVSELVRKYKGYAKFGSQLIQAPTDPANRSVVALYHVAPPPVPRRLILRPEYKSCFRNPLLDWKPFVADREDSYASHAERYNA